MKDLRYLVKGKELADLLTDKHLEDLYYGKSGNLVALTLKDPDTIELHGRRDDLDDMVRTLARDYEKGVVTFYEMRDGQFVDGMSIDKDGFISEVDYQGNHVDYDDDYKCTFLVSGDHIGVNLVNDYSGVASRGGCFFEAFYKDEDSVELRDFINVEFNDKNSVILRCDDASILDHLTWPDFSTFTSDGKFNIQPFDGERSVSKETVSRRLPLDGDFEAKDNKVPAYDDSLDSVYEELERKRNASESKPDRRLPVDDTDNKYYKDAFESGKNMFTL